MRHWLPILLCSFVVISCAAGNAKGGIWSQSAVSIWGGDAGTIPSPDGTKAIVIRPPHSPDSDETHDVIVRANGREYRTDIGAWVNAEAAWSPDSKAFFVTYSDGGNIGTYHVKIINVEPTGLRIAEPVPNGRTLFVPTCFEPERPNVGAIKWMGKDASRLLIAVQVPPHSSCASMGTFKAFEIAIPDGSVLGRYGQLQAKKSFRNELGVELVGAEDACIEKPETCVPSGLKLPNSKGHK
jgi:hypothetical protein